MAKNNKPVSNLEVKEVMLGGEIIEVPAKPWYLSKTIWIEILQIIAGVIGAVLTNHPEIGMLITAKSVVTIILRTLTVTAIK